MAWQFDRPEAGQGIIQAFRRSESVQKSALFKLRGLDPGARYSVADFDGKKRVLRGAQLMEDGLDVRVAKKPGAALIIYNKRPIQ